MKYKKLLDNAQRIRKHTSGIANNFKQYLHPRKKYLKLKSIQWKVLCELFHKLNINYKQEITIRKQVKKSTNFLTSFVDRMGSWCSKNKDKVTEKVRPNKREHPRETDLAQTSPKLGYDNSKQVSSNSNFLSAKRPRKGPPSRKAKEIEKTSRANKSSRPQNRREKTGHPSEPTRIEINDTEDDNKSHANILSTNSKSQETSTMSASSKDRNIGIEKDQQEHCTHQKEKHSVKHGSHFNEQQDTRSVVIEITSENIVTERKTQDVPIKIDSPHHGANNSNGIGISNNSLLESMTQVPIINQGNTSKKSPNEFRDYGTENGSKLLDNPYVAINVGDHLPNTNDLENSKNKKGEIKSQRHENRETGSTFPVTYTDKSVPTSFSAHKMPGSEVSGIKNNSDHIGLKGPHVEHSKTFLETDLDAEQNTSIVKSQDKPVSHLNYNVDNKGILKKQPISLTASTLMDKSETHAKEKTFSLPHRDTGFNNPTEIEVAERTKENNYAITKTELNDVNKKQKITSYHRDSLTKQLDVTTGLVDKNCTETHAKSTGLPCRDTGFNNPTEVEVMERTKENNSVIAQTQTELNDTNDVKTKPVTTSGIFTSYLQESLEKPLDANSNYKPVYKIGPKSWNSDSFNAINSSNSNPLIFRSSFSPNSVQNYGSPKKQSFDYGYAIQSMHETRKYETQNSYPTGNFTTSEHREMETEKSIETSGNDYQKESMNNVEMKEAQRSQVLNDIIHNIKNENPVSDSMNTSEKTYDTDHSFPNTCIDFETGHSFNSLSKQNEENRHVDNCNKTLAITSQQERDEHESEVLEPNFDLSHGTSEINPGPALTPKIPILTSETNKSLYYSSPLLVQDLRVNLPKLDESEEEINSSDHNSTSTERLSKNLNDSFPLTAQNGLNIHTGSMSLSYFESPPSENMVESKEKPGTSIDNIEDTENLHAEKEISTSEFTSPTFLDDTLRNQDQNKSETFGNFEDSLLFTQTEEETENIRIDQISFAYSDSESESNNADIPEDNKYQETQSYRTNKTSGIPIPLRRDENTNNTSSSAPASSHHQRPEIPLELPNVTPSLPAVEYLFGKPVIRESHFKSSNYAENLASQEIMKTISALNATSKEIDDLEANMIKYSGTVKQLDTFERIVTKAMLKLDKIESHGKPELRARRKDLVIRMKALLKQIDEQRNVLQSKL